MVVVGLRAKIVAFRHQMTTPKKKNNMETIGRYQIKAELGRGGMAVVYRAFVGVCANITPLPSKLCLI